MIWLDRLNITGQYNADVQWAKNTRDDIQILSFEKYSIRIRDTISGENTLFVVADTPNTVEHYDSFIEQFKHKFRVIVIELPGHGFSVPNYKFDFSLAAHTECLKLIINKLQLTNIFLTLPCVAAYIGLPIANSMSDKIAKVILLQAPSWEEERKWVSRIDPNYVIRRPIIGQIMMSRMKIKLKVAKFWYKSVLADRENYKPFLEKTKLQFDHKGCYCLASMLQQFLKENPTFEPINQETIVIWGLKDKSHLVTDKKSILTLTRNPQYHEWEDAGHFPELEQTERFFNLLVSSSL